jgi:probable addiction module antidote protein
MPALLPFSAEESATAAAPDSLESEGASRLYLAACFLEDKGDGRLIKQALNRIAKAKGISGVARASGLTRAGLYKALSDEGDPKLSTVLAIMKALDLTR